MREGAPRAILNEGRPHVVLSNPPNGIGGQMVEDAKKCGFLSGFGTSYILNAEFAQLIDLFPYLRPNTASLLVMGIRCGVAAEVLVLAALEATNGRVSF